MTAEPPTVRDVELLRRVHPEQVVWDSNLGRLRPTSAAFRQPEMSVNIREQLEALGLSPEHALAGHPQHHLTAITAALLAEEGQTLVPDPLPDDPSHANVVGPKPKKTRNRFAAESAWRVLREEFLSPQNLAHHLGASPG